MMEYSYTLLYKSDNSIFYVNGITGIMYQKNYDVLTSNDYPNVEKLDKTKILFHYIANGGASLPIYCEVGDYFITHDGGTFILNKKTWFGDLTKDYTLKNINLYFK